MEELISMSNIEIISIFDISMNYFLAKTDPKTYSINDLEKDKETVWDGVHNYQAINFIKQIKKDDLILIYHSQGEGTIVGLAKASADAYENKNDARFSWAFKLKFVKRIDKKITSKDVKTSGLFNDWVLVRNSRLSTMDVPEKFVKWLEVNYSIKLR